MTNFNAIQEYISRNSLLGYIEYPVSEDYKNEFVKAVLADVPRCNPVVTVVGDTQEKQERVDALADVAVVVQNQDRVDLSR